MKTVSVLNCPPIPTRIRSTSKPGVMCRAALLVCATLLCSSNLVTAQASPATITPTITQLFTFPCNENTGSCPDGTQPSFDSVIQASDGNFYGAMASTQFQGFQGGTIFKLTPTGQFTLLFTFTAGSSGSFPNGNSPSKLVEGKNGLLFGIAASGGANNQGAVFSISKSGSGFKVLHSFCAKAGCADGALPISLILANDGSFEGTTLAGGLASNFCVQGGCGTIFRITPTGSFTMVHALNFSTDGEGPSFNLLKASNGNFFGLDQGGNANGNIFRVTPGAAGTFTIVFNLPGTDDPISGLVQDSNGDLFGATLNGEGSREVQLFSINTNGSGFQSFAPSFDVPIQLETFPTLLEASDGNLWSVISNNGITGNGTVFSLGLTGEVLQSVSFDGTNGNVPNGLVQLSDGTLLGTTTSGGVVGTGSVSGGTVFTVNAGLPAPAPVVATFSPASGAVGAKVTIRGNNFVGTTEVTFNGISASFQVLNSQFISATVPADATTGPIAITNVGGTATSRQRFTVN